MQFPWFLFLIKLFSYTHNQAYQESLWTLSFWVFETNHFAPFLETV